MKTLLIALLSLSFMGNAKEAIVKKEKSQVGFKVVKRVLLTKDPVVGKFKNFSAFGDFNPATNTFNNMQAKIMVNSVDTGAPKRDQHLQGSDFFESSKYPTITFKSSTPVKVGKTFKIPGTLTMKGNSKPVVLSAKTTKNTGDQIVIEATTNINRFDYGVSWAKKIGEAVKNKSKKEKEGFFAKYSKLFSSTVDAAKDNLVSETVGLELKLVVDVKGAKQEMKKTGEKIRRIKM